MDQPNQIQVNVRDRDKMQNTDISGQDYFTDTEVILKGRYKSYGLFPKYNPNREKYEYLRKGLGSQASNGMRSIKQHERKQIIGKTRDMIFVQDPNTVQERAQSRILRGAQRINFESFCHKRFDRFPRFTIFIKQRDQEEENKYTVSLNP